MGKLFQLKSNYSPTGDQPEAIRKLTTNVLNGVKEQTLLGATGTGKTFTIANVIDNIDKPVLVLAHNKTLAGQLYAEFKNLFPENRVEYFISYYDYYQPEAYVPSKDMYIEKDSSINDEIDELRHAATSSILERKDTIIVASVSCIYGIGDPDDYKESMLTLRVNEEFSRDYLLERLVQMQYVRNNIEFVRGSFRVKGDNVDIIPANEHEQGIRITFFDNEIEKISYFEVVSGRLIKTTKVVSIFPATHFVTNPLKVEEALRRINQEMEERVSYFKANDKFIEAQRIKERTTYDMDMIKEVGSCSGIENYSRHMSLREEGETPSVLIDFFKNEFLLVIDESHVTIPQVRGMYNGDRSRKQTLVDYGFRLPSALDNRPLNFKEFENKIDQVIYVSATPGDYEKERSYEIVEQIIRPTGLLDPLIEILPTKNQIDDVISKLKEQIKKNEKTLITTLTIKMSEDLTNYLKEVGIKVAYLHSEIKALERMSIIRKLRQGVYDCIVGINLLREGLDIPEVSMILILDADKEGFLRSERSLIQTIGRAARNANGKVIMYADKVTDSMSKAIQETYRRRAIQEEHNKLHNITPTTIKKAITEDFIITKDVDTKTTIEDKEFIKMTLTEKRKLLKILEEQMKKASKELNFEEAMMLRDAILEIKETMR
ncbi:MAG: excinuclease ABC subunit UvrB [Bacilli bacterium]|nr:excinuclease ABC subunit UvrB [Bacilli bacterium]